MASNYSTGNRAYFLSTKVYAEDVLLIERFNGSEGLSQSFRFTLQLLSASIDIDPDKMLGEWGTLRIETDERVMDGQRRWTGYISQFRRTGRTQSPEGHDLYTYECDLVPWLWFLSLSGGSRFFQDLTVPEIIESIFNDYQFDFEADYQERHARLDYCVQYRETDFDFVTRLMEREGIHYYYRHETGGEDARNILVLTDHPAGNRKLDPAEIEFHHLDMAESGDAITSMSRTDMLHLGEVRQRAWDFVSVKPVEQSVPVRPEHAVGDNHRFVHYRFPAPFVQPHQGVDDDYNKYLTEVRMQAEETTHVRYTGASGVRTLTPGYHFQLSLHDVFSDFRGEYLVVSVEHEGNNNLLGDAPSQYGNTFTIQRHDVPYRAPLTTRSPFVAGPQTAIVVDDMTDEYGRVKLVFPWDRDAKSSCWVRVAQMWAGNGYGSQFLPRVGHEVVVSFLDGDPNRPLVTGSVYNGINAPPVNLPGEATRSTIKTLSKGGGKFNELRFEDKDGSEEIFLHAGRDLQIEVDNEMVTRIKGESHTVIERRHFQEFQDESHSTYQKNTTTEVQGELHLNSVGNIHLSSKKEIHLDAPLAIYQTATKAIHLDATGTINISALGTINLKAGSGSITIGPGGVTIDGPMVRINSGGAAEPASKATKADKPKASKLAKTAKPGKVTDNTQQAQARALIDAACSGNPFCAVCEAARAALTAMNSAASTIGSAFGV